MQKPMDSTDEAIDNFGCQKAIAKVKAEGNTNRAVLLELLHRSREMEDLIHKELARQNSNNNAKRDEW